MSVSVAAVSDPSSVSTHVPAVKSDGSWDSRSAGPVYGTSMMVLAFTVPHRQLPIYQRDETVDEE